MNGATRAKAVSYLTVLIGFAAIVVAGVKPQLGVFRALLGVPGLAVMLLGNYDRSLWRLGSYGQPVLIGTWRGELNSSWRDASGQLVGPIPVFVVIRQTATTISITLLSEESRSSSVTGTLTRISDGQHDVTWAYRNEPLAALFQRSGMHYGAAMISGITDRHPLRLEGKYWTDRRTTGDLILTDRNAKSAGTYREAQTLFAITAAAAKTP